MMKLFGSAVACLLLALSPAMAQNKPVLELRTQSVNTLLDYASYLGDLANQGEIAEQLAEFLKSAADGKTGLEGIDPKRPFGAYGFMTEDVVDSPIVLMIPLADQDTFLDLIRGRLNLDPRKAEDGSYTLDVPMLPEPATIRFQYRYAYLIASYGKIGGPVPLIDPKTFFPKVETPPVLEAKVFLDRIPNSVRQAVIANAELMFADAKERDEPGESPAMKKLRQWALGEGLNIAVQLLKEAESVTLSFTIDPKSDQLTLAADVTAKAGTALRTQMRTLQARPALAGHWLQPKKQPVQLLGLNLALGATQKKGLAPIIEALFQEIGEQSRGPEQKAVRAVLAAIKPTLQAGELDLFQVIPGEPKRGLIPIVFGLKVVQGRQIEETIKKLELLIPDDLAKLTFDVKTVAGFTIHKVEINQANDLVELLGSSVVWLAISDTAIVASVEKEPLQLAQALELLQSGGGKPTPLAISDNAFGVLFELLEADLSAEKVAQTLQEAFAGSPKGKDRVTLSLEAKDGLQLRVSVHGKAIKLLVLLDEARKN